MRLPRAMAQASCPCDSCRGASEGVLRKGKGGAAGCVLQGRGEGGVGLKPHEPERPLPARAACRRAALQLACAAPTSSAVAQAAAAKAGPGAPLRFINPDPSWPPWEADLRPPPPPPPPSAPLPPPVKGAGWGAPMQAAAAEAAHHHGPPTERASLGGARHQAPAPEPDLYTAHGPLSKATCVAWSPDGQQVTQGGWPRDECVWPCLLRGLRAAGVLACMQRRRCLAVAGR
jgi:hypothetical protein